MLERQGIVMNQKKLRRLYREEKLQVRRRGGRKRALGTRRPMLIPDRADARWSLDFVSDTLTDGRRFRVLAVVDDYTRECLALIVDTSLSGLRVVRELDAIIRWRGRPATIVSDNGTELTSMAIVAPLRSNPLNQTAARGRIHAGDRHHGRRHVPSHGRRHSSPETDKAALAVPVAVVFDPARHRHPTYNVKSIVTLISSFRRWKASFQSAGEMLRVINLASQRGSAWDRA